MIDQISRSKLKDTEKLFLAILKKKICERDGVQEIISGLGLEIDWELFLQLAVYHRVENLILEGLKDYFNELPSAIVLRLKGYCLQDEVINLKGLAAAKEILKDLNDMSIEAIPLKGILLSHLLYGDINSRGAFVELDLLVPYGQRKGIEKKLEGNGFTIDQDTEPEGFQWQKNAWRWKDNFCIDLHWNLSRHWKNMAAIEEVWRDSREYYWEGIPVLNLSWEDTLLFLSLHLVNSDNFRQLIYIGDIARFIQVFENEINWAKLVDKARRYKLTNSLYYALLMPERLLSMHPPAGILDQIKPSTMKGILIYPFIRRENYFAHTFVRKLVDRYFSFFLFDLMEARTLRDYLKVMRFMIFSPRRQAGLSFLGFIKRLFSPLPWLIGQWQPIHKIKLRKV